MVKSHFYFKECHEKKKGCSDQESSYDNDVFRAEQLYLERVYGVTAEANLDITPLPLEFVNELSGSYFIFFGTWRLLQIRKN